MADEHEETHTLRRPIRAPFVWSPNEEESKTLGRLVDLEPDLTEMVEMRRAWRLVTSIAIKVAIGLSALSGGFFVLREVLRGMVQ